MGELGEGHPIFAAFWHWGHKRMNPFRARVAEPAVGSVLEIGAGGGENLPYYGPVDRLVLTEPDPYMLRQAEARVRAGTARAQLAGFVDRRCPP